VKRLLLVRHGESEANVIHSLDCGVPGPPLSPLGHEQAQELADKLADLDIQQIYASTMQRAVQTVTPLAQRLGLPITQRDGLREFDVGDLHPRNDQSAHQALDELMVRWLIYRDRTAFRPDGESAAEVVARFRSVLVDVLASYDDGVAVVATHGGALRLVGPVLFAEVTSTFTYENHVPNTGIIDVEVKESDLLETRSELTGLVCHNWAGIEL
jgi:broad specificity phosphatase PhoE